MDEKFELIQKAFGNIYWSLDKFYQYNRELIEVFDVCEKRGYVTRIEVQNIEDLFNELDGYIKFRSEGNENIGDYLI